MQTELARLDAAIADHEKQLKRAEARVTELRRQRHKLEADRDRARLKGYVGQQVKYRFQGDKLSGVPLSLIKVKRKYALCETPSGERWNVPINHIIPSTEASEPAICGLFA